MVAPVGAESSGAAPKATEIGVTATEIRIAVEADVDNPFAPGLFQGVVDGVRSAAKYLNSKSGGGGSGAASWSSTSSTRSSTATRPATV